MDRVNYKATMRTLMQDLSNLLQKKESLEDRLQEVVERIAVVREAAWSMRELSGIDPDKEYPHLFSAEITPDVGFTDAIREVFRANLSVVLTPVGVRNKLKERGFKLQNYKNPLASIHTILKRLEKQGELHGWQDDEEGPVGYAMMPETEAEREAVVEAVIGAGSMTTKKDTIVGNPPFKPVSEKNSKTAKGKKKR